MKDNPLYNRLTHNSKWPSLRACLWLAFGLGLATLTASIWDMLHIQRSRNAQLLEPLGLVGWAVSLIVPGIVAAIAILMAAHDKRTEAFQALRVTPLSEKTIVWGYAFAALHRARALIGLVTGLMPATVLWPVYTTVSFILFYARYGGMNQPDVVGESLVFLTIVIGLWGMNLLAAVQGSLAGLKTQNAARTIVLVGLGMVAVPGIVLVFFLALIGPSLGNPVPQTMIRVNALAAGLCLLPPYLATIGMMFWVKRQIRIDG